ncbi:Argininosuccinate lyase [Trichinella pseudospiralis]
MKRARTRGVEKRVRDKQWHKEDFYFTAVSIEGKQKGGGRGCRCHLVNTNALPICASIGVVHAGCPFSLLHRGVLSIIAYCRASLEHFLLKMPAFAILHNIMAALAVHCRSNSANHYSALFLFMPFQRVA